MPDTKVDELLESLTDNIDSLIDAIKNGTRHQWIKDHFLAGYPTDIKDSSMILDLLKVFNTTQHLYECVNCGRIAVQIGQTNRYEFYKPESEDYKGILKGKKDTN
ncbi:hypothetical protein [Croceimicrobium hydrocarbonivorans]|uniref:Uncharacterized protein n=1 Tax=Croceimicrobium hydrocarbonivorans TaxID=2761580 RepID=A0A7H0VHF2_9FLAO|nr:hypothetical protein [Croceimicrobium hydrocarbonivorans]QNR25150.1 hypothetical protein H4K34_04745 [Croceimicrobium hydrocarbonivorans]